MPSSSAVDAVGRLDPREPRLESSVQHQEEALIDAPDDERPRGAMPEAAEDHGQHQVAIDPESPAAVASQRDVKVIAQPLREADVPSAPEVLGAGREIGEVEVQRELEAQALGDPSGDVGIAGEVAVDLEGERIDRQEGRTTVESLPAPEKCVDHLRQVVGDDDLLEQPPEDQVDAFVELLEVKSPGRCHLRQQRRRPHDRAGDQVGKKETNVAN